MVGKSLLLLSGLAVSGALARSAPKQAVFKEGAHGAPMTFTVTSEAEIERPAEVAVVHMNFNSEGPRRRAVGSALARYEKVMASLENYTPGGEAKLLRSRIPQVDRNNAFFEDDEEPIVFYDENMVRRIGNGKKADADFAEEDEYAQNEDESGATFYAWGSLSARFNSLDVWNQFIGNLSTAGQRDIEWVDWELTEATKAAAQGELRRAAVAKARVAGSDYAEVFEGTGARLIDFEEQWQNTFEDGRWGYGGEDYKQGQEHSIKMTVSTQATFELVN